MYQRSAKAIKQKFPIWDSLILGGIIGVMSVFFDDMIELAIFSIGFGIAWGLVKAYIMKKKGTKDSDLKTD
jgi:hypothetical protein